MTDFKHGTSSGYSYHKCRCEECKAFKKLTSAADYAKNREKRLAQTKCYYQENREQVDAKSREYRERTFERHQEYQRQYLKDNAEQVNRKNRDWRRRNKRKVWAYQWIAKHRERGGGVSEEVAAWIKSLTDDLPCTYCGAPWVTLDHIIPISKGGTNIRANLTPACQRCNIRKQHTSVEEFMARLREEP